MGRKEANKQPGTLPAAWYHDPAIFGRERDTIFARHWTPVARLAQLGSPGDFVTAEIAGRPIFVIRDRAGRINGFHNVCRHRAGPIVSAEAGRCDVLRCRYHGWVYGQDGRLVKAPGFAESREFERGNFDLFPLRTATWNDLVFAALDRDGGGLESWLGDIVEAARDFPPIAAMIFRREAVVEGNANWKAYGDNSVEGYHLPFVHKSLSRSLKEDRVDIDTYENGGFVGFKVQYGALGAGGKGRGFWIYKFPGVLLHFSEQAFNIERVVPIAPGRIRLIRWFWALETGPEGPDDEAEIEASIAVMHEDLGICEAVQRNLEAGVYSVGRLSPTAEKGTIFFQALVRAALDGAAHIPRASGR
jgi:choline monooxygenase